MAVLVVPDAAFHPLSSTKALTFLFVFSVLGKARFSPSGQELSTVGRHTPSCDLQLFRTGRSKQSGHGSHGGRERVKQWFVGSVAEPRTQDSEGSLKR